MRDNRTPHKTPEEIHAGRRKRMGELMELNAPNVIVANECLMLLRSCMDLGVNPTMKDGIRDMAGRLTKLSGAK